MKLFGSNIGNKLGRGGRPLTIAYGRVFHEACAHSPLTTEREDFERMHHLEGQALADVCTLRGAELQDFFPHAELTGFVQAARAAGDVTTVPLSSSLAVPNGPLSRACFDWILETLVGRLETAGPLDGVYLALHGSMEVHDLGEAPESVILRRVREVVGDDVMVAASYDLHANLSAGLIDPVDVMVAYRTNPHWDLAPTGWRAGNRLIRALRGKVRPVHAWRKLPMVLGGGMTINFLAPMRGVFRFMRNLEKDPRVLTASLFMVHPYTSAEDLGWAVHVSTDDDGALAERLVEQLADRAWAQRRVGLPPLRSIDEVLEDVADARIKPASLVDVDDIVGAGAPGGNTRLVEALVKNDRGLSVFVPVHDPELLDELWARDIGERDVFTLRGTPGYEQPEVELRGQIRAKAETPFGRIARVDVGSFHVAVCERPPLPIHPNFWKELGLTPRRADALVQKNFFHYRIFYVATTLRHFGFVSAGATSLERVRQRAYRVPTYPTSDPADWREGDRALRAEAPRSNTRTPSRLAP